MRTPFAGAILASLLIACHREQSPAPKPTEPPEPPVATAPAPVAPSEPPAPEPIAAKPERVVEVEGLKVGFYQDGRVSLSGVDRFGEAIETTYESMEYLKDAVPVLGRSITREQTRGLERLVARKGKGKGHK